MLSVADTLHHLTGDVRTRIEHALLGQKSETESSNKTIGAIGERLLTIGDGIAATPYASTVAATLTFGLAFVPITQASLYVWPRFRGPVQNERITKKQSMPEVNDLHHIKDLQEQAITLRTKIEQLVDQTRLF
ncbi:hypothetical protein DPMN_163970 [Dreissena polymorpha]|uniref:Uncharacterized protein n=1 Tax=Dreissena polymorpha TaxID=45954 RepID=A0A9D4EST9_DREPO|nr:hypothetical protein DPMN_163970 [Dreissena polymorpha]